MNARPKQEDHVPPLSVVPKDSGSSRIATTQIWIHVKARLVEVWNREASSIRLELYLWETFLTGSLFFQDLASANTIGLCIRPSQLQASGHSIVYKSSRKIRKMRATGSCLLTMVRWVVAVSHMIENSSWVGLQISAHARNFGSTSSKLRPRRHCERCSSNPALDLARSASSSS